MDISLAFEIEENHFLCRHFSPDNPSPEVIFSSVQDPDKFLNTDLVLSENLYADLFSSKCVHAFPSALNITRQIAEKMSFNDATNLFKKINENSIIKNNLDLIHNLTCESKRLSDLFKDHREIFILNLWKNFYHNLMASDLKIIFQTISQNESKTLIHKTISSANLKELKNSENEEVLLFDDLEAEFGKRLNIIDYNQETNQLTATCTLNSTKLIIMANVHQFTILQESTLNGLLNSIHFFNQA